MKFCPHCGTPFEASARFCLECGFDKSTVEPTEPEKVPTTEAEPAETLAEPLPPSDVISPTADTEPHCLKCGTVLDPGTRFCEECGFDTTAIEVTQPETEPPQVFPMEENVDVHPGPASKTDSDQTGTKLCPQCETEMLISDRFCPECGMDTSMNEGIITNNNFPPVEQPAEIYPPKAEIIPPLIPEQKLKPEDIPPPPPESVLIQTPAHVPPTRESEPAARPKRKKNLLWIVLVIIVLGILGVAGWYVYFGSQGETSSETISNMALPPVPDNTTELNTDETADTLLLETDVNSKSLSKVDQELERQRVKERNKNKKTLSKMDLELAKKKAKDLNRPAPGNTSPANNTIPDPNEIISSNTGVNNNLTKVIFEVGRKDDPKNKNPKNPTKFTIQNPTMIVRITTDHYNNGMGTSGGGTISIMDRGGNVIAAFKAYGKKGTEGTPSAKWVCEPHKVLVKGTYSIVDSDMTTWSKTFLGTGFVLIEGYEVQ